MATSPDEFEPYEHIARSIKLWWVLVLCAVLGGLTGYVVNRFKVPLYEAQAVFMASIDFNKVDFMHPPAPTPVPYKLTQYDEDISLVIVEASLIEVEPQVVAFAQKNGFPIDGANLIAHSNIERHHGYWYLRLRDVNPVLAQKVVNFWAQAGLLDLQAKQKANQMPAYVFFSLAQLAELPASPKYFQTNVFVLAGIVIGLVVGILVVNMPFVKSHKDH
jgi:hypothetical protein